MWRTGRVYGHPGSPSDLSLATVMLPEGPVSEHGAAAMLEEALLKRPLHEPWLPKSGVFDWVRMLCQPRPE